MAVETQIVANDFSLDPEVHDEFHIVTFAEPDSSMLIPYGEAFGVKEETIKRFASAVNDKFEVGSMAPLANLTAVPKRIILNFKDSDVLFKEIIYILRENDRNPKLQFDKILFDFRNAVAPFIVRAVTKAVDRLYRPYKMKDNGSKKDKLIIVVDE